MVFVNGFDDAVDAKLDPVAKVVSALMGGGDMVVDAKLEVPAEVVVCTAFVNGLDNAVDAKFDPVAKVVVGSAFLCTKDAAVAASLLAAVVVTSRGGF